MAPTPSGVSVLVTFHFFFCRAHGRAPGLNVYFWMVSFRQGDTAADLESLRSWVADNRQILRWADG